MANGNDENQQNDQPQGQGEPDPGYSPEAMAKIRNAAEQLMESTGFMDILQKILTAAKSPAYAQGYQDESELSQKVAEQVQARKVDEQMQDMVDNLLKDQQIKEEALKRGKWKLKILNSKATFQIVKTLYDVGSVVVGGLMRAFFGVPEGPGQPPPPLLKGIKNVFDTIEKDINALTQFTKEKNDNRDTIVNQFSEIIKTQLELKMLAEHEYNKARRHDAHDQSRPPPRHMSAYPADRDKQIQLAQAIKANRKAR